MHDKYAERHIREIYAAARSGEYERRFKLPRNALATVESQGDKLTLMLTPRAEKANLNDLTADIEMLTMQECETRMLTSVHGYCEMYQNRNPWSREPASQEFFEHIFRHRGVIFGRESPVYRSVVLYENGDVTGRIDFVQENTVAHTLATSENKQTRSKNRAWKNKRIRHAQAFFAERYHAAMRAVRIDGKYHADTWDICCTDIATGECHAFIASFK